MKKILFTVILLMMSAIIDVSAQSKRDEQKKVTLKTQMEALHDKFGVNFVYDSSINLDIPCQVPKADNIKDIDEYLSILLKDTSIGFEIIKKHIVLTRKNPGQKNKDYTPFIEEKADTLKESLITAAAEQNYNATKPGLKHIDGSSFRKGFAVLSSQDVIKEIQNLPGVSGGTELLSGMYVHGGDGTDNLFLLDGVPLYQVSHLAGLISSFNTEVIDNLDFYKSCFPSRLGGKLSSVIEITTRPGDMNGYHGSFNIGLLNGGIQFEGPIVPGKTSFNIGLRRSWMDLITIPAIAIRNAYLPSGQKDRFRYAMTDVNASLTHLFRNADTLSLNIYGGSDLLRLGREETLANNGLKARWGNILCSLNWKRKFSNNLYLNTLAYYTNTNNKVNSNNSSSRSEADYPYETQTNINERHIGNLHDIGFKADINWLFMERNLIRTGVSLVQHMFRPYRETAEFTLSNNMATGGSLTSGNQTGYSTRYNPAEISLYIEDEIILLKWLRTDLGLRYVVFGTRNDMEHAFEPRVSMNFQIKPNICIKLSYSEMSQFIHNIRSHYLDIPLSCWMPATDSVPPMHSRQIAGGLYANFPGNLSFIIEGFWKSMDNLSEYNGIETLYPDFRRWEQELIKGEGRAYGMEMEVMKKWKNSELTASYTLSWNERHFADIYYDWYPARNDNRHKFTINATHRFSSKFDISLGWICHSGNRMTIPTQIIDEKLYYSSPYNYRLPAYHRLDAGANLRKTTKRGNESIWNVSIYNAYCRLNPMFTQFDRDSKKLKTVGIVPIIPSFSYTLRF